MFKKSLLIALTLLLLPVSMVISTGTASAAIETEASLKARILTNVELKAAVETSGSIVRFKAPNDIPSVKDDQLVSSGRVWETAGSDFLAITLFSFKDGHNLTASEKKELLGGGFTKSFMEGTFDSYEYVGEFGTVLSENDVTHGFYGKLAGQQFEVLSVTFVQANVFGLVLYASTGSNEGLEVWSAYGGQTVKLP